jgi:methyl-accepting chemotaxis protein
MTNRLQNLIPQLIERHPSGYIVLPAWVTALLLLLAYSAEPLEVRLLPAAAYALVGLAALLVTRLPGEPELRRALLPALGAAASLGLLLLPAAGDWTAWLLLCGLALLPLTPALRREPPPLYAGLTLIAALVGVALAGGTEAFRWDAGLGGLALLAVGLLALLPGDELRREPGSASPLQAASSEELNELLTRIHVTVDGLVRAAQAINDVTEQQSEGANEQVDVLKLTNTMMDDFLKLSEQVNQQARAMTETSQQTSEVSEDGQTAIRQAITGMDQIREQVNAIGTTIVTLAQLTRRIDEIITSVSEVATQSNLLALNASIEAARAGAHGRGFAVVADEVRALSLQSTNAARQVRDILAEIQAAVRQTVSATEAGMQQVDAGAEVTRQADHIMQQLAENVAASNQGVRAIYEVIRQQAQGLEEIAISMERVDRITQQNLTSTRMITTVSTNLTRLADELQEAVQSGQRAEEPAPEEVPERV